MNDYADLAAWWPVAERRLRSFLRRQVYESDVDELVAETAVRAVQFNAFDDEAHLVGWSVVVARNLVRDQRKQRNRRTRISGRIVQRRYDEDLADYVDALAKRDALLKRIDGLPSEKRAAFLGEIPSADPKTINRMRVAKTRTSKELRAFYGRLGVAIGGLRTRLAGRFNGTAESVAGAAAVGLALLGGASLGNQYLQPNQTTPTHPTNAPAPVPPRTAVTSPILPERLTGAQSPPAIARSQPPRALVVVPLGESRDGQQRSVAARPPTEEEAGVMACIGERGQPGFRCLYWPEAVQRLGEVVGR